MAGKSPVMASDEQRAALAALAGSRDRGEADRARAVLLTLTGWTSPKIAEAFGVREDTVRLWRSDFTAGGVAALKASIAPGPPRRRVMPPCAWPPLAGRTCGRPAQLDDPPPSRRDRGARGRAHQPFATLQGLAKKKFRWRRPRHTLKGRQMESEVERVGLRLQLRKQQAEAGDIVLLYGDESEALTHPYLSPAPGRSRGRTCVCRRRGRPRRSRCWGRSITSRANSSSIPARPSAAVISSPIWSNSTVSMDRSPGNRPSQSCWSKTMVRSTPANARSPPWPPAHTGSRRVAAEIRARTQRHRAGLARSQGPSPRPPDLHRRRRARPGHP